MLWIIGIGIGVGLIGVVAAFAWRRFLGEMARGSFPKHSSSTRKRATKHAERMEKLRAIASEDFDPDAEPPDSWGSLEEEPTDDLPDGHW